MPEIVNVARRILVFKDYRIVGEVRNDGAQVRGYDEISQEIGAVPDLMPLGRRQ